MIENKNEASRNFKKALQALEQAKQRVDNEKKKQNEKKRKAEKPLPHNPLSPMPRNSLIQGSATELAYAEVISYNKKNLERELQNESRQHNRQQDKAKRRGKKYNGNLIEIWVFL